MSVLILILGLLAAGVLALYLAVARANRGPAELVSYDIYDPDVREWIEELHR